MPQDASQHFSDDEHPFLTPKGLRLQRQGRKDSPVPMEFPIYPPSAYSQLDPIPHVDPFAFGVRVDEPIYNVLPSVKFPQPEAIGLKSLNPFYKSRLVANPQANELRDRQTIHSGLARSAA